MGVSPAAVILTPYGVDPMFVRGGAQRVAAEVCDRLTELGWTAQIIECMAWADSIDSQRSFAVGMAGHSATVRRWRDPAPATSIEADHVDCLVRAAGLVLVLDRAVGQLDTEAHRVLLLSNLVYDNERQAAAHGDHDAVWLPSEYLAELFAAGHGSARVGIHVVPPALAEARCNAVAHEPLEVLNERLTTVGVPRERRLLFPHRTDPGKGLASALQVLQHLLKEDRWALVVVGPGAREGSEVASLVEQTRREATATGIEQHIFWTPWLPHPEVFCLYKLAGVTLMPSTLQEGFGLVAVESLAQGVPVVAQPVGNLQLLAQRFQSIHLADEVAVMAKLAAAQSGRPVLDDERRAVHEAFSVAGQRTAIIAALDDGVVRA